MVQDTVIKFRATAAEKARLRAAAERSGRTVSGLLRKAALDVASGHRVDRQLRTDLVALRRSLNALYAESGSCSRDDVETVRRVTSRVLARLA